MRVWMMYMALWGLSGMVYGHDFTYSRKAVAAVEQQADALAGSFACGEKALWMAPTRPDDGKPLGGIPPFYWGLVLGPLGVVLVYFLSRENWDMTRPALWGCVLSMAVVILIRVLLNI